MKNKHIKSLLFITTAAFFITGCSKNNDSENYSKYVKLGDYKNLTADRVTAMVTDEDVQSEIQATLSYDADYKEITDRAAQKGDIVNIDFTGTINGAEFEGGSAEEYEMELGTNSFFVEGFEEGILGMKTAETKEIPITFPDDYDDTLAGQDAVFSVTLNSIYEVNMPEYNDAYVSTISEYSSTKEYEAALKEELQGSNDEDAQVMACESALYQLIADSEISGYPQELYDTCKTQFESENQAFAEMFGVSDVSEVFGEDYDAEGILNDTINERMVVTELARAEKITVSEEELNEALEEELPYYDYPSVEELKKHIDISQVRYTVLYQKVLDYLGETCTFHDVSEEEYYGESVPGDELYEDEAYVSDEETELIGETETEIIDEETELLESETIDVSETESL